MSEKRTPESHWEHKTLRGTGTPSTIILLIKNVCSPCVSIHLRFKPFRHFYLLYNEALFLLHSKFSYTFVLKVKTPKSKSRLGNLTTCACQAICVCARNKSKKCFYSLPLFPFYEGGSYVGHNAIVFLLISVQQSFDLVLL